ncbi:hypothetical protein HWE04_17690 [Herbaspirillum sp. C7C2]|nr:hypothetical protein [Herbaspirillum sp. C7C2]
MPWLLAARRKKLLHLLLLPLLKLLPLQLLLLTQSRLMPLLLLPRLLTPLLRLLTLPSLLTLLRPLTQSRLKPLLPSNLRIIVRKTGRKTGFFSSRFSPHSSTRPGQFRRRTSVLLPPLANPSRTHQNALQAIAAR